MKLHETLFILIGIGNILVGIMHLAILPLGAPALSYLGAPPFIIALAQHHQWFMLSIILTTLAALFCLAGLYALSAAKVIPTLPFVRIITLGLGLLYTLRGSVVLLWPMASGVNHLMKSYPAVLGMGRPIQIQDWTFSFLWLIVGIAYLIGYHQIKLQEKTI